MPLSYKGKGLGWEYSAAEMLPIAGYVTVPSGYWEKPYQDQDGGWHPVYIGEGEDRYPAVEYDAWGENPQFASVWREPSQEDVDRANKLNSGAKQYNDEAKKQNRLNTARNAFHESLYGLLSAFGTSTYTYLDAKKAIADRKNILTDNGMTDAEAILTENKMTDAEANQEIDNFIGTEGKFRNYYQTEIASNITEFDSKVFAANLSNALKQRDDVGGARFNTYTNKDGTPGPKGYYFEQTARGKKAEEEWEEAIANDDLDFIKRYGTKDNYGIFTYLNDLTDATQNSSLKGLTNIRASQAKPIQDFVTDYKEQVFPDSERQQAIDKVQNKIFGLIQAKTPGEYEFRDVQEELSKLVSSDKTINNLWSGAQKEVLFNKTVGDATGEWSKLIKSLGAQDSMLTDKDSFGTVLARVANLRPNIAADKKIIDDNKNLFDSISALKSNATFNNLISYAPTINDAFRASVQASEEQQIKKFGQLRQSVLQDTINELKIAKQKEANLSFLKSSSVGKEISALTQDITGSLLGDLSIGGMSPFKTSQKSFSTQLETGLGDIFGTRNGLIYNWEDWFNNQLEKKYAGNIDIPNDYVAPKLRTLSAGFVDTATIDSWKKYDDAYETLKTNPNDFSAKAIVANLPLNYVSVANRKTVNKTWTDYEAQLKTAGYVDPETLASWAKYDDAYAKLQENPNDVIARKLYDSRPGDYIVPDKRMDRDVQFAKDFFSTYLKPRFDASQSITEFQDYIDVVKGTQNPFQTQDRLNALKLAAQTSVSQFFAKLQQAGDSKFNSKYYFDPVGYLKEKGIGNSTNPLLSYKYFNDTTEKYEDTEIGKIRQQQKDKVEADWITAKEGGNSVNKLGTTYNWLLEAYNHGVDVEDKEAFAKLHYQLIGTHDRETFDPAPDVYGPAVAEMYVKKVLTPELIDKANKIGSVFGEFVKPADYVGEVLKIINLPENKEQWAKLLEKTGLDPNASLTELKNTLVEALSQDSTTDVKKQIGELLKEDKTPTQTNLGVEYLQKTTASGTEVPASGVYAVFKNAGYNGTESEFYSTFLPDSSPEDISIMNAAYTPKGALSSLLPTVSGTGTQQIASMAQFFGDTSITEVLGIAGVEIPSGKTSPLGGLFTTSEEDIGIGDPFADESTPFTLISGTSSKNQTDKIGIDNSFDVIGITDPFADESDPFSSSNPFSSIGSTSSISTPKIKVNVNASTQGFSSKKNSSFGSLFDNFGGF